MRVSERVWHAYEDRPSPKLGAEQLRLLLAVLDEEPNDINDLPKTTVDLRCEGR